MTNSDAILTLIGELRQQVAAQAAEIAALRAKIAQGADHTEVSP